MIGSRLGAYQILAEIGEGGMATVYRAFHEAMGRMVAVKALKRSFTGEPSVAKRFQREARLVAQLEHPHLLPVYDFDGTHDPPYIVMRYLRGGTLKDLLRAGRVSRSVTLRVMVQVCTALDYAHRQGVVHRDVKPSNILFDREGNAFLSDFGLARTEESRGEGALTMPGVVLGTPGYMAPEQVVGSGKVDHRADVYAMGVVLYHLLTGEPPFAGKDSVSIAMAHVNRPVPQPSKREESLPASVDRVVATAMAKAPKDRYSTAAAFLAALTDSLEGKAGASTVSAGDEAMETRVFPREVVTGPPGRKGGEPPVRAPAPDSRSTPTEHTKQVTALSATLAEFAELLETKDLESAPEILQRLRGRLQEVITGYGGRVEAWTTDSVLALWGVEAAREDDPERAVSAALQMRAVLRLFLEGEKEEPLPMQVGIATGFVLLVPGKGTGVLDASGAAISLARRVERLAPPGRILLSRDTGRNVQRTFDLVEGPPIRIPGRGEPSRTFVVSGVKEGLSAVGDSSVGFTPGTVLRREELARMKEAFRSAREGRTRVVTICGERGLGKTRLLAELTGWLERKNLPVQRFAARAEPGMEGRPTSFLRELLLQLCGLDKAGESDRDPAILRQVLTEKMDFSDTGSLEQILAYLLRVLGSGSQEEQTVVYTPPEESRQGDWLAGGVGHIVQRLCRKGPVVVQLSDLHWADGASLSALTRFVQAYPSLPFLAVCLARPGLFNRSPGWAGAPPLHQRIDLAPLTSHESRAFVREILQEIPDPPDELVEAIISRAEGNPYFIEELVQVLRDDRIIEKGKEGWEVRLDRLGTLQIPSTLTGLVQVHLDRLQPLERMVLQRAAVVGWTFWDAAVGTLGGADHVAFEFTEILAGLAEKGLIEEKEISSLEAGKEYAFSSSILREVVLESIPGRLRRAYHESVARWLADSFGGREGEYAALIGEHFERAGKPGEAGPFFLMAGERAMGASAFDDARVFFSRALSLLGKGPKADRLSLPVRLGLGQSLRWLGENAEALDHLSAALALAKEAGDTERQAEALYTMAQVSVRQEALDLAQGYLEESLEITAVDNRAAQARALYGLGDIAWRRKQFEEAWSQLDAGLLIAREVLERGTETQCLIRLGSVASALGDYEAAEGYLQTCKQLALDRSDRRALAVVLNGLGEVQEAKGRSSEAKGLFQESLALSRAINLHEGRVNALLNLGFVTAGLGESVDSAEHFKEALWEGWSANEAGNVLSAVVGFAVLREASGDRDGALELLGLALNHPCSQQDARQHAEPLLAKLEAREDPSVLARGLGRGVNLDLDKVVNGLLERR